MDYHINLQVYKQLVYIKVACSDDWGQLSVSLAEEHFSLLHLEVSFFSLVAGPWGLYLYSSLSFARHYLLFQRTVLLPKATKIRDKIFNQTDLGSSMFYNFRVKLLCLQSLSKVFSTDLSEFINWAKAKFLFLYKRFPDPQSQVELRKSGPFCLTVPKLLLDRYLSVNFSSSLNI